MREFFKKSVHAVNSNILIIILIGIVDIQIFIGQMSAISVVGSLMAFILSIVLFGRLADQIQGKNPKRGIEIVKANIFNYVVVTLVLALPIVVIGLIGSKYAFIKGLLKFFISIITIYVIPIVFIKNMGIPSIAVGVSYLMRAFRTSIPIIALVILIYVFGFVGAALIATKFETSQDIYNVIPLIMVVNVVATYFSFMVYAAAASILVANKSSVLENSA